MQRATPLADPFLPSQTGVIPVHQAMRARLRDEPSPSRLPNPKRLRAAACGLLGVSVGVVGAVAGVSWVQANDRVDMFEVIRHDQAVRQQRMQQAPRAVYTSASHAYAPTASRPTTVQPLAQANARGQILFPDFDLNPFRPMGEPLPPRRSREARSQPLMPVAIDTVSGAADMPRSICVRLCDGYQHPMGYIRDNADLKGHEALCQATFPGVPTRVFRVAAGAPGIDDATGPDGKTYRSLPMAYAYQTSIDPACARPRTGERTVSILRDFTLRPGDTVVLEGRARVFTGGSYPYTSANFRDFRQSNVIGASERRKIDDIVGISRMERLRREARAAMRVREANAGGNTAVDVVRGGFAAISGEPVRARVIAIHSTRP